MPDKTTRFSLALILLFIAPSAWGRDGVQRFGPTISGYFSTPRDWTIIHVGGGSGPFCEPGWELVMRLNSGGTPQCARALKEPIWK